MKLATIILGALSIWGVLGFFFFAFWAAYLPGPNEFQFDSAGLCILFAAIPGVLAIGLWSGEIPNG